MEQLNSMRHRAVLALEAMKDSNRPVEFIGNLYINRHENGTWGYLFVSDPGIGEVVKRSTGVARVQQGFNFRTEEEALNASDRDGIYIVEEMPPPMNA